jgi:hypothetical protein
MTVIGLLYLPKLNDLMLSRGVAAAVMVGGTLTFLSAR